MTHEEQLVSFGEYLLSKERANRIKSSHVENEYFIESHSTATAKVGKPFTLAERKRMVYHADVENWKEILI